MWLPPNVIKGGKLKGLKFLIIAFWVPTGATLLLCVILQLYPFYWQALVLGAAIVIAGTAGSQLLPEWKKINGGNGYELYV